MPPSTMRAGIVTEHEGPMCITSVRRKDTAKNKTGRVIVLSTTSDK